MPRQAEGRVCRLTPLVMRAPAGSCLEVTLRNRLPEVMPDLPGYGALLGVVNRDRNGAQGMTTFQGNLVRPSSLVGLHPQLVEYDVSRADGAQVGINKEQLVAPGESRKLQWFAGEIRPDREARRDRGDPADPAPSSSAASG